MSCAKFSKRKTHSPIWSIQRNRHCHTSTCRIAEQNTHIVNWLVTKLLLKPTTQMRESPKHCKLRLQLKNLRTESKILLDDGRQAMTNDNSPMCDWQQEEQPTLSERRGLYNTVIRYLTASRQLHLLHVPFLYAVHTHNAQHRYNIHNRFGGSK